MTTPLAYIYLGTQEDGCVASGVIGAIHPDGITELWERTPNLGTVIHMVRTDSLEAFMPLHALPEPVDEADYKRILDQMVAGVKSVLSETITSSDELRRIADRIAYLADYIDFARTKEEQAVTRLRMQ